MQNKLTKRRIHFEMDEETQFLYSKLRSKLGQSLTNAKLMKKLFEEFTKNEEVPEITEEAQPEIQIYYYNQNLSPAI